MVRQFERILPELEKVRSEKGRKVYLAGMTHFLSHYAAVQATADRLAELDSAGLPAELLRYGNSILARGKAAQVSIKLFPCSVIE